MYRRSWRAWLLVVLACGGKTGLPEDRLASDAGISGPCPDQHPCATAHCSLVVPTGALPPTAKVEIVEREQPVALKGETTASFVCEITASGAPVAPLGLTVSPGVPITPDEIIFRYEGVASAVKSSTPSGDRVQALVPGTGVYGLTRSSPGWKLETTYENDPLASADTPSFLRNLSRQATTAAYWDGAHFFLGNGPRVLIWDGMPVAGSRPDVVVGAPDLDHIPAGTSSSKMGGNVNAIWSNGEKLLVATGNRVLIWSAMPRESFATADLVLGQQDFVSGEPNLGGVSASTLFRPSAVDSDGTRLIVADTLNHRVLAWSKFPTSIGDPASSVLGQSTFASNDIGLLHQPWGAILDREGAYVASYYSGPSRVDSLASNTTPASTPIPGGGSSRVQPSGLPYSSSVAALPGAIAFLDPYAQRVAVHRDGAVEPMSFVLGQPDPARAVTSPVSASAWTDGRMVFAHGRLLLTDRSRVLVYDQPPSYNFEPASRVVGEAGFSVAESSADYRRVSGRTLASPSAVATNGSIIAVADRGNSRVLLYRDPPRNNAAASVVLGHTDETSFLPNVDQLSPSGRTLAGPGAIAIDSTRLYVADTENHRVLVWSPIPTRSGTPASVVLGQSDFVSRRPNHGNGDLDLDGNSDADDVGMFYPSGIATNGTQLFVTDRLNHRVLVWNDVATLTNGRAADRLIGQSTFAAVKANRGAGAYEARLDGFNLPTGIALDGSSLWVADTENNRAVRWDDVFSTPTAAAVIGQANGTSVSNPNVFPLDSPNAGARLSPAPTATTVIRPRAVAVRGETVFVSEAGHRVHAFQRADFAPLGQIGQRAATTSTPNENGIGAQTLQSPEGLAAFGNDLFIADAGNHRVLQLDVTTLLESVRAAKVIGQPSFSSSGFNQSAAVSAGGSTRPRGMSISNSELLVAETSRHRVVVHELPLIPGRSPKLVYGQPDSNLSLPNAGGPASASTLSSPNSVFADGDRVAIADTGNNRVLLFARGRFDASVVVGQPSFDATTSNRNGEPSAATLAAPSAVSIEGNRLFVVDTGNHRVLVWDSIPTQNGQPADHVLGQSGFALHLANRGGAAASERSLNLPTAVLAVGENVFVADSGNNRVVAFRGAIATNAVAAFALGQPDLRSRTASSDINDATRLSGPVALATDGTSLLVADRDSNRVVAYDLASAAPGAMARTLFNSNSGLVAVGPAGLALERTPLFTSRLFLSDTNNDRVLVLSPLSRLH